MNFRTLRFPGSGFQSLCALKTSNKIISTSYSSGCKWVTYVSARNGAINDVLAGISGAAQSANCHIRNFSLQTLSSTL
jgi:hypothetical protein